MVTMYDKTCKIRIQVMEIRKIWKENKLLVGKMTIIFFMIKNSGGGY